MAESKPLMSSNFSGEVYCLLVTGTGVKMFVFDQKEHC